jgi:hypothetical protein
VSLSWLWHPVAVNVVSAALIAAGGFVLKPQVAHSLEAIEGRRECSNRVLHILALCSNLEGTATNPSPSVQGERDRWISQLDEATLWLADNWEAYALTYAGWLGGQIAGYAGLARGTWLSGNPLEQRVHTIREATAQVQTLYFAGRIRSLPHIPAAHRRLQKMLNQSSGGPS